MTNSNQLTNRGFSNLQVGSINDVDSFDTDRLSGSIRYDDDIPQPIMDYETIRKDEKKSTKKEDANEKRMQRQREKDEKKARKQEEKERQKSRSRTRIDEQNPNSRSNNRSKARIVLLDDTDEYVDLGKDDTGKMLYLRVCELMHLEEKDYFGLTFLNNENTRAWLDNDKRVRSQLKGSLIFK
jgi:hypothetical protein